ncbi:nucleoside-diphosphate sugar epimerase [Paenibacillus glucanolyticus]|uniref:Nucleoside-diphosphate sugar epimerase n=1 Tax=Paenibacillus glucanolyticus TaxID=59843 RepID=A0A163F8X3_9BACL|nr:NAD-dependent epimerase/dehydratase family protein [Paenibacillus glucanolyticus]KZS44221.1 nucleoside-diphosphate sugar epimerase [Paenibacillus glucanolyticus]
MKVFVTGATGYIGGSVAKVLIDAGHTVYGLVRNPDKIDALKELGIDSVLGTLDDTEVLARYAEQSDAVIHTADSDHRLAVETFILALRGSGKPFLHTSGSSVIGDDARGDAVTEQIYDEETPFTPMDTREDRVAINNQVRRAGRDEAVRSVVIVPSMIYGEALGLPTDSDQLPQIIRKSREVGAGVHVGKGVNRWSNVHIRDLAQLYLLALTKAPSASYFFAENGEESYGDIAIAVSKALGFGGKTVSWSAEDAIAELGDWARFAIASNSRVRAVHARNLLGWKPAEESLLDWIEIHLK